jgi:hypothetical protein
MNKELKYFLTLHIVILLTNDLHLKYNERFCR